MPPLTDGTGTGRLSDKLSGIFLAIPRSREGGIITAPSLRHKLGCDDALELSFSRQCNDFSLDFLGARACQHTIAGTPFPVAPYRIGDIIRRRQLGEVPTSEV